MTELIRRLAAVRPGTDLTDAAAAAKLALKHLANRALHTIVLVRMRHDQRTREVNHRLTSSFTATAATSPTT